MQVANEADIGTVRIDTGVFEGGTVSMYYDAMISKLCTHAPTRCGHCLLQALTLPFSLLYLPRRQSVAQRRSLPAQLLVP
jgi:hypothetical protein